MDSVQKISYKIDKRLNSIHNLKRLQLVAEIDLASTKSVRVAFFDDVYNVVRVYRFLF